MLIPRYSLRNMLAVTAALCVLFLIVSLGLRGHHWAAAMTAAAVSVVAVLLIHMLFFAATWIVSLMQPPTRRRRLRPILAEVVTIPPAMDSAKPSPEEQ